jgi:hypothetical protein
MDDALQEIAEAEVDAAVLHPPSSLGEAINVLAVDKVQHEICRKKLFWRR